jgi:hypothetical protein
MVRDDRIEPIALNASVGLDYPIQNRLVSRRRRLGAGAERPEEDPS